MPEQNWLTENAFTVEEFLTPEECQKYIQISEDIGYEEAMISSPQGQVLRKDIRNNQRVMFKNEEIANWIWERASEVVPQEFEEREAIGVNELLRFYRYDPGQQFNWHQDFSYERENGEQSFYTLLIYLNGEFEGGATSFEDSYSDESFAEFSVEPKAGMALFFEHPLHHKGEPVIRGRKYILRTDVMYAAEEDEYDSEEDYEKEWD
ncbi:MAG: hypothetical protein COA78_14680 [Blastopirellula sp.]|nr:MAG: hypothetical protein COA78_14680 [Blastopirellula sp.]